MFQFTGLLRETRAVSVSLHTSRLSTSQGNVSGQDEGACLVCVEKAPFSEEPVAFMNTKDTASR